MSCLKSLLLRTFLLLSLAAPLCAQQPQKRTNPADVYLQAYLIMEDGLKLLNGSDFAGAYYKFKDAQDMFDSVFHSDPEWNPEIVEYRRKKVRELRETARAAEIERRKSVAGSKDTVNPNPGSDPGMPARQSVDLKDTAATPRPTEAVVSGKVQDLQERIRAVEARNEALLKEIGMKDQQLRDAGTKLVDAQREQREMLERLEQAKTRLDTANAAKKREQDGLAKRLAALEKEHEALKAGFEKANRLLTEANAKNAQLLSEVQTAYENIKTLTKERDQLVAEREQMTAIIQGDSGAGRAKTLAGDNLKLRKQLEELQQRLASLEKDREKEQKAIAEERAALTKQREADQQKIASLMAELEASRTELAKIRQENHDYQEQMAALSARLEATERALSDTASPGLTEDDAMRENAMLHEIILKMLKQQSGREKAKQSVVAALEQNGQLTEEMLKSLSAMAAPYQMTQAERSLLQAGGAAKELPNGGGVQLELMSPVAPGGAASADLPKEPSGTSSANELRAYATAAETCFRNQNFAEAEDNYVKILKYEPQNVEALCNLAVVQLRQAKNEEALKSLKKAQAYKYDNDFAHYLMGVVYLRQSRLEEASQSIVQGLKLNANNSEGYLSLGFINLKQKRFSEAERNFKRAVELDSKCADAHYNLAVLYATADSPKLDLAKSHYREAIANGASRDAGLDKLLGR